MANITINTKHLLIILVVIVVAVAFIAILITNPGVFTLGGTSIRSADEASEAITDISSDVEDVSNILDEIDDTIV